MNTVRDLLAKSCWSGAAGHLVHHVKTVTAADTAPIVQLLKRDFDTHDMGTYRVAKAAAKVADSPSTRTALSQALGVEYNKSAWYLPGIIVGGSGYGVSFLGPPSMFPRLADLMGLDDALVPAVAIVGVSCGIILKSIDMFGVYGRMKVAVAAVDEVRGALGDFKDLAQVPNQVPIQTKDLK